MASRRISLLLSRSTPQFSTLRAARRPTTFSTRSSRSSSSSRTHLRPNNPVLLPHPVPQRNYSTNPPTSPSPPSYLNAAERSVFARLSAALQPSKLEVQDISGGCGSMYGIEVVSAKFAGLSTIKQHRLVNEILKEEIKGWHGVQLKTKVPE